MTQFTRRSMVAATLCAGGLAAPALAQTKSAKPQLGTPPSVISNPPRQWGEGALPVNPDPDVIVVDPAFNDLLIPQGVIHRAATGFQWTEGPAWCAEGNFALFSDVKASVQYRYIWETAQVTPYRKESYNSNGNCFDFQGRQISCEGFWRRVVRYEIDGSLTVIADNYQGKPLNSPNDVVAHPDGSIWFTDPFWGAQIAEGRPDLGGGPLDPGGTRDPRIGNDALGLMGPTKQVLPPQIYRWDPSGRLDIVAAGKLPNGLAFSPDYKKLYFLWDADIAVADVTDGKLSNIRTFSDTMVDGVHCGADGMRVDKAGNLWAPSSGPYGYSGVTVWNSAGKLLGRIRLPEICGNLAFVGPKRDWLFMTASQSIYMLRVNIQGASPG